MSSPIRLLVLSLALCTLAPWTAEPTAAQEARRFSREIALDIASPQVAAGTEDGTRAVVVVRTRRGRVDVDHERYGDPTHVAPALASVMVVDTRTRARSWLHERSVRASGFTRSPERWEQGLKPLHVTSGQVVDVVIGFENERPSMVTQRAGGK